VINDYPGTKLAQEAENRIDHIIANPIGTGGKKSFLASIPFIKKLVQKPEEEYEERALEKDPFKKKQAAQKKKFWEFWKKSEKAVAVEQKEDAKKVKPVAVAKGKKQFWEFWKKSDAAASKDVEPVVVAKKKKQQKKQFWEIWKKTPPAETEKEEEVPNVGITGRDGALTMRELGASEEEDQISQEPTQTMTSYEDSGYLLPKKAGTEIAQASVDSEESEYIPSDEEIEAELMSNEPIRSEDFDESSIPAKDTAVSLQEEFDEVVVEKDDIPSVVKDAAQKISDGESISVEDVLEARDARTGASPASRISKVDDSIAPLMSDDYEEEVDEAAFDEEVPAEIPIEFDLAQISDLKLVESDKGKKMVFATNKAIDFVSYRLENPTRLMIAMKSPTYSSLDSVITVDAAGVKTVRSHYRTKEEGHVGWQVNAIVLDFDDNIKYKVSSNENAITIELKQ